MKYLKLFEEATNVPDYFLPLESINHYLDPKSGVIYPILKSGGYDERNDVRIIYLIKQVIQKPVN
jgi:hypothetical protein